LNTSKTKISYEFGKEEHFERKHHNFGLGEGANQEREGVGLTTEDLHLFHSEVSRIFTDMRSKVY
jgi:hypothetical protein